MTVSVPQYNKFNNINSENYYCCCFNVIFLIVIIIIYLITHIYILDIYIAIKNCKNIGVIGCFTCFLKTETFSTTVWKCVTCKNKTDRDFASSARYCFVDGNVNRLSESDPQWADMWNISETTLWPPLALDSWGLGSRIRLCVKSGLSWAGRWNRLNYRCRGNSAVEEGGETGKLGGRRWKVEWCGEEVAWF